MHTIGFDLEKIYADERALREFVGGYTVALRMRNLQPIDERDIEAEAFRVTGFVSSALTAVRLERAHSDSLMSAISVSDTPSIRSFSLHDALRKLADPSTVAVWGLMRGCIAGIVLREMYHDDSGSTASFAVEQLEEAVLRVCAAADAIVRYLWPTAGE